MVGGTVLPANTATITGELSGTAVPLSPSTGLFIVWTGSDDSAIKAAPSGATSYTFTPTWLGLSVGKRTGVVHALQLDSSSRAWRGYAKYAVAVDKDETVTADLNMIEPPVVRVSGAITPPVGFAAPEMIFSFHFGERSYPFPKIPISGPVDFPIPVLEDGTVSVQFSSKKDAALSEVIFNDVAAASDVTHQLMDPPTNLSPAANMIASVKDHFTWMAPAGTVSAVEWRVGGVTVTLFTTETDVTLPKVEGVVLSPDNAGWTVHAYGPMTKVDDLAGPTGRKEYKAHSTSGVSPFVLTNSP